MINGVSALFFHIYAYICICACKKSQEFERKQGQGPWEELEEGKGMEGNDHGKETSTPDDLERQIFLPSSKAVWYVNGFVMNMEANAFFFIKKKSEIHGNCEV